MTHDVRIDASPVGPIVRPPRRAAAAILYLHGDRYLTGTPESALGVAGHLAAATGTAVVCARYRSAFPAALEDVLDGYRCSQAVGPVRAVAGERAGAGLAAALLVRLRDAGAPRPGCAVLLSGLLDLTLEAPSLLVNAAADPGFDAAELRRRVASYAAGTDRRDPLLSPLHANLHGLPPLQLLAAGNDLLVDDSLAFATRAARSGIAVDLRVWPDAGRLRRDTVPAMAGFIVSGLPGTSVPAARGPAPGIPAPRGLTRR